MKVSIIGYYGANFGDLLMLKILISHLERKYEKVQVFSYGDIGLLATQHFVNNNTVLHKVGDGGLGLFEFYKHVKDSSSIFWGGGSCFMDQGGTGGVKYLVVARFAGVKVGFFGIGIDSCKLIRTKILISIGISISSFFLLRDRFSIENAKRLAIINKDSINRVCDLSFINNSLNRVATFLPSKYLVFSIRNLEMYFKNPNSIYSSFLNLGIRITNLIGITTIYIVVSDLECDQSISQEAVIFFEQLGIKVVLISGTKVDEIVGIVANASYVLTMRLHVGLVALKNNIPFGLFNYSEKNKNLLTEFNAQKCLIDNPDEFEPILNPVSINVNNDIVNQTIQKLEKL